MLATLTVLVAAAGPLVFTTGAEPPVKTEQLELPPRCSLCPAGRVTCTYYPGFMVREIDTGDVGAELLGVVPLLPKRPLPACKRERPGGEISLTGSADAWSGYFDGARGRFAFFRREDVRGDAVGFTVFDTATEQRVLTDEAIGVARIVAKGDRVGIAYARRAVASCSPLSGGEPCWSRIRTELGVADPPPDCAAAYREANEAAARASCTGAGKVDALCVEKEVRLRPAVPPIIPPALTYEVEIPDLGVPSARAPEPSKVLSCRPGE